MIIIIQLHACSRLPCVTITSRGAGDDEMTCLSIYTSKIKAPLRFKLRFFTFYNTIWKILIISENIEVLIP